MKHHFVVVPSPEGAQKHPLKAWVREHPEVLPDGLDPTELTSHRMRYALKRAGWQIHVGMHEGLVVKPDSSGNVAYAQNLISELEDESIEEAVQEDDAEEITFGLERDLQQALRRNIEQLEAGLVIIDGGKERSVEGGRIDILAKDKDGRLVVIELKAGTAMPEVIAQITAYMACIEETDKAATRGILVAGDFHKRVKLSSKAIPSIQLKQYSFRFSFGNVI